MPTAHKGLLTLLGLQLPSMKVLSAISWSIAQDQGRGRIQNALYLTPLHSRLVSLSTLALLCQALFSVHASTPYRMMGGFLLMSRSANRAIQVRPLVIDRRCNTPAKVTRLGLWVKPMPARTKVTSIPRPVRIE